MSGDLNRDEYKRAAADRALMAFYQSEAERLGRSVSSTQKLYAEIGKPDRARRPTAGKLKADNAVAALDTILSTLSPRQRERAVDEAAEFLASKLPRVPERSAIAAFVEVNEHPALRETVASFHSMLRGLRELGPAEREAFSRWAAACGLSLATPEPPASDFEHALPRKDHGAGNVPRPDPFWNPPEGKKPTAAKTPTPRERDCRDTGDIDQEVALIDLEIAALRNKRAELEKARPYRKVRFAPPPKTYDSATGHEVPVEYIRCADGQKIVA